MTRGCGAGITDTVIYRECLLHHSQLTMLRQRQLVGNLLEPVGSTANCLGLRYRESCWRLQGARRLSRIVKEDVMSKILCHCAAVVMSATLLGWTAGAGAHTIDLHPLSPAGVSFSEGAGPIQFDTLNSGLHGSRVRASSAFMTASELRTAPADIAGFARLSIYAATPASFDDLLGRIKRRVGRVTGFVHADPRGYSTAVSAGAASTGDTWLMVLVGVGLIGYQLRRKQRSLQPHPFVA